ncbi:hypothetical protein ONZ51_g8882 [Trametes cubensis]|uniref:Uncharacterized protein n=1 Tax=Trametes cubensis TaxID=1111947 RepID=A0AAD7X648_9APHY|nr:hypothetical protein ONZ51_g8882 [Trametes cubensis]
MLPVHKDAAIPIVHRNTLLAQLASNKKFPDRPLDNMKEWHESYWNILSQLCWSMRRFEMTEINDVNNYGSMDALVLQDSSSYLTGHEYTLFKRTIDALQKPENRRALQLLDAQSSYFNDAGLQVGVASNSEPGGNALLRIGSYQFTSSDDISSALFFNFGSSEVQLFTDNQVMVLDNAIYENMREAVRNKLGIEIELTRNIIL